jgi:hypothetical protein
MDEGTLDEEAAVVENFQYLRALLEEATKAIPNGANDDIRAALRVYLALHCRRCGAIIPESLRASGADRCAWCSRPPLPLLDQALREGDDDLPF